MKQDEEIKLYDDPKLVEYRTNLEGWTGSDGLYHGKGKVGEARARYANSTHLKCDCGEIIGKVYSKCDTCRKKSFKEGFDKLEQVEWDGASYVCLYGSDEFFSNMDEVNDYCEENDVDIHKLELMHCEKQVSISKIDIDDLNDDYTDKDGNGVSHFHPEIAAKVKELNELIAKAEPKMWFETKKKIKL